MKHALSMRLQRVESSELVEFPETEEGYLGKVACFPPNLLRHLPWEAP